LVAVAVAVAVAVGLGAAALMQDLPVFEAGDDVLDSGADAAVLAS
jgi:hypothetical protein